jgi:hypothetical protein
LISIIFVDKIYDVCLLRIFNYIVEAIADGDLALLCLLDLSAAFDTVDHSILVRRLELSYGINGQALSWLSDYLAERSQTVRWSGSTSAPRPVRCGVPQGSVLGPLLLVLYVADVGNIANSFDLATHAYADDAQIYSSCQPRGSDELRLRFQDCIQEIMRWTAANRLALNPAKTELLWFSTPRRNHLVNHTPFLIGEAAVVPVSEARLLGVLMDATLSFSGHLNSVIRTCYLQLRNIREIRRYLSTGATIHLVRSFILSRLDYSNSILYGLPEGQLNRLQSILNASARVIFRARWHEHVTPLLMDKLHWLKVTERIVYKRCWITFRALNDTSCPAYLSTLVRRREQTDQLRQLRSSSRSLLHVPPPSKTAKFGERSMSQGNPLLWNSLPDAVTKSSSAETFANNLKTHLFKISYNL